MWKTCINAKKQSAQDGRKSKLNFDVPDAREEKNMQVELLYKRIHSRIIGQYVGIILRLENPESADWIGE